MGHCDHNNGQSRVKCCLGLFVDGLAVRSFRPESPISVDARESMRRSYFDHRIISSRSMMKTKTIVSKIVKVIGRQAIAAENSINCRSSRKEICDT